MHGDPDDLDHRRSAASSDPRFDGWFITAAPDTRIYCRPSCPVARTSAGKSRCYPTAAAAQRAGFHPCQRCRPDAAPGSPQWSTRSDVVGRAMRLIADGTVDRDGVSGLADRLGCSSRQLQGLLQTEAGVGPLALARAQRAQTARALIEATTLPFGDVAHAAGFASVRQFTDTVRAVFGTTPAVLRRQASAQPTDGSGRATLALRLAVRTPFAFAGALGHLAACAVPGCEEVREGAFRRTLRLPHGHGVVSLTPADDHVRCLMTLDDLRDLSTAITRCRRLLDLDADPVAVIDTLSRDPDLRNVVARAPGQRIPGTVDEAELAVRVVLSQQVSIKAASTHARRLVLAYGEPLANPDGGLTHLFPSVQRLAALDPDRLALPQARRRTLTGLVAALAGGQIRLDPGCDWISARRQLLQLPGIGPWSTEVIAMRGLGDPDAFPVTDLGVRVAARQLGLPGDDRALEARSARWRPWRSYATQHLWTTLDHSVNEWPPQATGTETA